MGSKRLLNGLDELPTDLGCYAIFNVESRRFYVGLTMSEGGIRKRCQQHWAGIRSSCHGNHKIKRDARLFGPESFRFFVLATIRDLSEIDTISEPYFTYLLEAGHPDRGYCLEVENTWTKETRLRDVERKRTRVRQPSFCYLPGTDRDAPFHPVLLNTWIEDSPRNR